MRTIDFIYRAIVAALMSGTLVLASCDVHEFPEVELPEPTYPVILYLDYNTDLPLYKILENQLKSRTAIAVDYDVRYIIETYKVLDEHLSKRELVSREVLTRDDVNTLNHSKALSLVEGKYELYVWTDYVDTGTTLNKYYNADDFTTITVMNHEGNNDFRDAYAGVAEVEIKKPDQNVPAPQSDLTPTTEVHVANRRPLAKFNFITTDLDRFIDHVLELEAQAKAEAEKNEGGVSSHSEEDATRNEDSTPSAEDPTRGVNIKDYKIVIYYNQFMPNEFDIFSYIPIFAIPNMSFVSEIKPISETEAELGSDYVFVNGEEFILPIRLEVYDKQGNRIANTNPLNVPLMRGQLTTVRDNFLTSYASGGIGINPGFQGPDYIFEVP